MAGNPPALPASASTATKVAFTIGAAFLIAGPAALPYSTTLGTLLTTIGGAVLGVGAVIHVYWDHST